MWVKDFDKNAVLDYAKAMADTFDFEPVAQTLELEIKREICSLHPLYGLEFEVLAMSSLNPNDYIVKTSSDVYPMIKIHLTWRRETCSDFPGFEVVCNEIEFLDYMCTNTDI